MSFTSYAQNGEDVMLRRALHDVRQGFYIDVGAQDPIQDSVTKAFYEMGWRGINIEPIAHWFERLVADRPHDINLQLAVSDGPGLLHVFDVAGTGLSTIIPALAERHARSGYKLVESEVQCMTLDGICEAHGVGEVHFLKVDCEGSEAAALRGLSLERVRPWIIVLEATEPNSQKPTYMEWEPMLTGRGYRFVYGDGLNRFYLADEHGERDKAFSSPPNVFDSFVTASEAGVRKQLEAAREDLSALRDMQRLARAESERDALQLLLDSSQKECDRRASALDESLKREAFMRAAMEHLRQDLDGRMADVRQAQGETDRLHHEVAFRDREVARLNELVQSIYRSSSWRISAPLRLVKRGMHELARLARRLVYLLLRWPAHLARPLLRRMLGWPWLRPYAARLAQAESGLARQVRLFLFGAAPLPDTSQPEAPLTRSAMRVLEEIHAVKSGGVRAGGRLPSERV